MASNNSIEILIKARDMTSATFDKVSGTLRSTSNHAQAQTSLVKRLSDNWATFSAISVGAGVAAYGLFGQLNRATDSVNLLQSSLLGLNSIARAFNIDAGDATQAARRLASDGLMTVADSARGLKNLLASGFSLDQAVALMERFKDSAAFGRQSALSFGQAVASATEGIKNGNSILVDNAGVTKNLSMMLTEAGFSAQDLMKATTDSSVRQAIYNGILKETNAQTGDAARYAESAAGKQAAMAAETEKLYQQIGLSLQPALLTFLETIQPIIQGVADWVSKNQGLASGLLIATGVVLGMVAGLGILSTAIQAATVVTAVFGPKAAASFGVAGTAFNALKLAVMTPMALPALILAAAIASLMAFQAILDDMKRQNEAEIKRIKESRYTDANANKPRTVTNKDGSKFITRGYATGVKNFGGGWAMVGDVFGSKTGELIHMPVGSDVYSNRESRDLLGGKGVTINQTNYNYTEYDRESADRELGWRLANA